MSLYLAAFTIEIFEKEWWIRGTNVGHRLNVESKILQISEKNTCFAGLKPATL